MEETEKFILGRGYVPVWKDSKGNKHLLPNMATRHINNILWCYKKNKYNIKNHWGGRSKWEPIFRTELRKRNEQNYNNKRKIS